MPLLLPSLEGYATPFQIRWILIPVVCLERLDIKAYVGAAWKAFPKNSFKKKGEQTWYAEFKRLSLPQSLFFTPDMTLENPEILFCLLLKRILSDEKGPRFIDNHTVLSRTAVTD
jgi:hypothetical protein